MTNADSEKATRCLGIVPARIMSGRLPGKPLKSLAGKPLVQAVWERVSRQQGFAKVVVATDDEAIFECARGFGAQALMTGAYNQSACDRANESVEILRRNGEEYDVAVVFPVSLPFVRNEIVSSIVEELVAGEEYVGATAACPIVEIEEFLDTAVVKTAFNQSRRALFFSRAPVPYAREGYGDSVTEKNPFGYRNIPLFAYRVAALPSLCAAQPDPLETIEELEQLRAVTVGLPLKIVQLSRAEAAPLIEVNTSEDLRRAEEYLRTHQSSR